LSTLTFLELEPIIFAILPLKLTAGEDVEPGEDIISCTPAAAHTMQIPITTISLGACERAPCRTTRARGRAPKTERVQCTAFFYRPNPNRNSVHGDITRQHPRARASKCSERSAGTVWAAGRAGSWFTCNFGLAFRKLLCCRLNAATAAAILGQRFPEPFQVSRLSYSYVSYVSYVSPRASLQDAAPSSKWTST